MDFVIDRSKWICGVPSTNLEKRNCLGSGRTQMRNEEGYLCCLGQVAEQLGCYIPLEISYPADMPDPKLSPILLKTYPHSFHTELTEESMKINDSQDTTVAEKEKLLSELFKSKGYTITFKY